MLKLNKVRNLVVATAAAILIATPFVEATTVFNWTPTEVQAAKNDKGVDWSKYQGTIGKFGYASDQFSIDQIGGYYEGTFVPQDTYSTQVQYTIAQGKRAHTYIYAEFNSDAQADQMLDTYLPQVQTPKGSIVALDEESGNPNTESTEYALQKIQAAGYTAVLYGYKSFLTGHLNLQDIANKDPLWLAEYRDYSVMSDPDYNYFPSFDNIGIFQFTSTYIAGGLDGDIDLTGLTDKGYTKSDNPKTETPAIKAGQIADNTPKKDITAGDTVKVNFGASKYATGETIPSFVKGVPHQVLQVSGNKVLLSDIMSWVDKSDVEILGTASADAEAQKATTQTTGKIYDDDGTAITPETGTFTAWTSLRVWYYAGHSSTGVDYYNGESVNYFGYVRVGQYVYVAYHPTSNPNAIRYLAVRDNGQALGSFQ